MHDNIVLIGFMGCGKSSIGRRLATRLGHRFLDCDDLITERAGKSISAIFADEGEEYFRNLETEALTDLRDRRNMRGISDSRGIVLATGGGAVLRPQNRDLLHDIGTVVWLHADADTLFERATRSGKRPLLEVENPRTTFNALLESRLGIYESSSDHRVDASGLSHDQTSELIFRTISGHSGESSAADPV